jgi:F-type H+-transporting ATPase subunit b
MANISTITASSGALVDIDATLFIQLAIFLIMLFLLSRLLFRPVIRVIEARREATEGTMARAHELEREAASLNEEAAATFDGVRASARRKRDELILAASEKEREIMAEAREKGQTMVQDMKRRAESDLRQTKAKLEAETEAFASMVAAKVLNRSV